jgi:predicted nucleic acid-binding protein
LASSRHREIFLKTREELLADDDARVIWFEKQLYDEGIDLFNRRADKQWSLTDCISFAAMKRESIIEALTGDHHFEQAGFVALLK